MSDNEQSGIKVTDKRMFAPDGTLREEYRFLEEEAKETRDEERAGAAERSPNEPSVDPSSGGREPSRPAPGGAPEEPPAAGPPRPDRSTAETARPGAAAESPEIELPGRGPERSPGFLDLVAALAEPASVYLRNAVQSPAEASQSLEVARLYIDLLDVLRQKTAGNLTPQESDMLEDALHQLRLGYVQTKG